MLNLLVFFIRKELLINDIPQGHRIKHILTALLFPGYISERWQIYRFKPELSNDSFYYVLTNSDPDFN
jgi:hypothetical protein